MWTKTEYDEKEHKEEAEAKTKIRIAIALAIILLLATGGATGWSFLGRICFRVALILESPATRIS
jgi:hypothetical protein